MSGNRLNTPKGEMSGNGSGPAIAHLPPGSYFAISLLSGHHYRALP